MLVWMLTQPTFGAMALPLLKYPKSKTGRRKTLGSRTYVAEIGL
ncbi:hypothetical protein ARMA_0531 [Ardenticatena maritima]|uniref:Uncharacterized protein n=1 Tax=Ardenticatena maritima TaxID=872965 RepID=A0A0N0RFF7_9CHLR|nr:hypothetical protein ARMA_0531 [Ardenticatena maritima]